VLAELQAGQNQVLSAARLVLGVSGEPATEFAARTQVGMVLLGIDGRVRDQADLISAYQPVAAGEAVHFSAADAVFQIDLLAMPTTVERLALLLTVRPEAPPGTTFSTFGAIRAWLADASHDPILTFALPLASRAETALILAEIYRHQRQWKFRAVGQGFAAGLSALAAHFGLKPPPEPPASDAGPRRSGDGETNFSGTGFCVHAEGYILTNHHVIEGASEIVARSPRQRCVLEPVFADPVNDLALLRAATPLAGVAAFRDGPTIRLGETVIVVGYPLGGLLGSGPQVTTGNVSSLIGPGDDTCRLQFTAPTQSGNSGGPLLDGDGAVVGVVSSKLNAARIHEMTGDMPQNVNFAIKAALARSFLEAVGVDYHSRSARAHRTAADIATEARDFVVKIECRG